MKYFKNLKSFENWDIHYEYIIKNIWKDEILNKAIEVVEYYHDENRYLYEWNYNRHPLRVARILIEEVWVDDIDLIVTWLLHDIIEWTNYPKKEFRKTFWDKIYNFVNTLSIKKWEKWNDFVKNIEKDNNKWLVFIKFADKLDNNRWLFFSDNIKEINNSIKKSEQIILPLIKKYYPKLIDNFIDSIINLKTKQNNVSS